MNKKNNPKAIAFLSNNLIITEPLFNWLVSIGEHAIICENKVDANYIIDNNISFVISYNYIHMIRKDVLELLPNKIINLHTSLLPWNRGADPNIWSFIDNTPCGVTIHEVDEGLDTGDILVQEQMYFDHSSETLKSSYLKLHYKIQDLFKDKWDDIKNGNIISQSQNVKGSYHRKADMNLYRDVLCYNDSINMFLQKASIVKIL